MTSTALMPEGRQRYFNNDGTPCAGGKLSTYVAGTTNPKVTYADAAGTVPNPVQITLDAKGEAVIYWSGSYKVDLKQADGAQVTGYPVDNYSSDPAGLADLSTAGGAVKVGIGADTVDGALSSLRLTDYATLRAYNGPQKSAAVVGYLVAAAPSAIVGNFVRDDTDNTSADNGGTVIVAANGKRWKRVFSGAVDAAWFGAAPANTNAGNIAALQAAADAAAENQDILIRGVIRCSGPLNITRPTSLVGVDARNANLPNYNTSGSHLIFTGVGSGGGIIGNANVSLRNLVVTSAADDAVNLTDASLMTTNVVIQGGTRSGVRITRGYYNTFTNTRIEYAGSLGAYFDNCYNISASSLKIRGTPQSIALLNGSTMTMHAGSVEDFGNGGDGISLSGASAINLNGTYFEGNPAGGGTKGVSLGAGCSITAMGCHVYANTMARWLSVADSSAVGVRVFSRTNKLVVPTDGWAVDVYSLLNTDATGYCDIAGDNWDAAAGANVKYMGALFTSGTGPVQNVGNYTVQYPANHPLHGKNINTNPWCASISNSTPAAPLTGTFVNFGNNGLPGGVGGLNADDPLGLHSGAWYYNSYMAVFQKGQWEKVGLRLPNQANTAGATLAQLETELNTLKANLRAAGVMI